MKHVFLNFFHKLSLNVKLTAIVWFFAAAITFIILLLFSIFYQKSVQEDAEKAASRFSENSVNIIDTNYTSIVDHFVFCYGTKKAASDFQSLNDPDSTFFSKRDLLQDELELLNNSNYLVQETIIFSPDGTDIYTSYSSPSISKRNSFISLHELQTCTGVTWLSSRPSLFRGKARVLPIVFPLSFDSDQHLRLFDPTKNDVVGYVVILIDCELLSDSLTSNIDEEKQRFFFLTDESKRIYYSNDQSISSDLIRESSNISSNSTFYFNVTASKNYSVYATELNNSDIKFVHYIKNITFFDILPSVSLLFCLIITIVLLIQYLVSVLLSRYVTKPVKTLVGIVQRINDNRYTEYTHFVSNDELGVLCRAINEMHHTIQSQIVQIQHNEAEKYTVELQLLIEQINPHFIYNTLNCIQAEVQSSKNAIASQMICDLADYLRLGLSYSNITTTVAHELRHAEAYVAIMTHRFFSQVLYSSTADPILMKHSIPKILLQPLLENSMIHGFRIKQQPESVAFPTIDVSLHMKNNKIHISVIDNGAGFDIQKTEHILLNDCCEHVGLHNIYRRLELFYGKGNVEYQLSSVPYFRNEISFIVPLIPDQTT